MHKNKTAVITINCNKIDWIKKHSGLFIGNLASRLEAEETDPWPDHKRWSGDSLPGTQVVTIFNSDDSVAVVAAGENSVGWQMTLLKKPKEKNRLNNLNILKKIAQSYGYELRKKSNNSSRKQKRGAKRTNHKHKSFS